MTQDPRPCKQCPSKRSLQEIPEQTTHPAVFMSEVKQLVAGEAILSEGVTEPRSQERSQDDLLEDLGQR